MTTVQVAITDTEYAQTISALLRREGRYQLMMVAEPDLALEGVVVLDCEHLERLGSAVGAPERFVLITRKDPDRLAELWNAGIRHVVFQEDPPNTLQLAVSAAELRQPRGASQREGGDRRGAEPSRPGMHRHFRRAVTLNILEQCGADCRHACTYLFFPRNHC
ncbi:MAG TPA: hypothetical protein VFA04_23930 [Bryobacteraceae bacterium]|nr:hypothetical protein [Bryobacteraceae bacterium]